MLEGDFFIQKNNESSDGKINSQLELNAAHKIFSGHFPGQPVVPGVCMIQMVKEILESSIGKKTRLVKSDHAKFLAMIDPRVHSAINATIKYSESEEGIAVTASLFKDEIVFLKLKAVFINI